MATISNISDTFTENYQIPSSKIGSIQETSHTEATSIGHFHGKEENHEEQFETHEDTEPIYPLVNEDGTGMKKEIVGFGETEVIYQGLPKKIMGFEEKVENYETHDDTEFAGFVDNQERNGKKKARRNKRRGKAQNKCAKTVEERPLYENVCERKSDGMSFVYSRKEMEDLRFVNVEDQKKKWVEVYCGLGPVVSKEYDALVVKSHHQNEEIGVDFDPRQNLQKKLVASGNLGEECVESSDNKMNTNHLDTAVGHSATVLDGCTFVEDEYCDDDDDSDAEYNSIQRPAFLVTGEPDFDSGPAQDGLEYLRRVRWEAERVQKVTFAKIEESKLKRQSVYMPKIPDIATCPQHLMPLKEWEIAFLADFSELRLALSRQGSSITDIPSNLHSMANILEEDCAPRILESVILEEIDFSTTDVVNSGHSSIDCSMQASTMDVEDDSSLTVNATPKTVTKVDGNNSPTLSTILGMDSVSRVSMLKRRIKSVETTTSLSKNDCAWLFALCAAVDSPLNADTSAALRDLLRKCANLRAGKSELDDEVVMLNILATIAGKYFGQSDN